jgi:hypothetical protein
MSFSSSEPGVASAVRAELLAPAAAAGRTAPIWAIVVTATTVGVALPVALQLARNGSVSAHFVALAFFFWLNAIIAFWEIALFRHIDLVREQYENTRASYRGRELERVVEFFSTRIPTAELLSTRHWAGIWSTYALFDPSYADKRSYGFFIDIGNGFSTLLPSLLISYAIVFEWFPARALGIAVLILSYQMLYGTLVYFTSFIVNRRYRGHSATDLAIFVGLSNGIWTLFPVWLIGVAIWMIYTDSFACFLG